jgi:hypothetical protein
MLLAAIPAIIILAVTILILISMWKIYAKAGQPGWAIIIPVFSTVVFFRIIGKPWWWLFLWMLPIINIIWIIWSYNLLSKSFGRSEGFTIGIILLPIIFIPILAFGSKYIGPAGKKG